MDYIKQPVEDNLDLVFWVATGILFILFIVL